LPGNIGKELILTGSGKKKHRLLPESINSYSMQYKNRKNYFEKIG